MAETKAEKFAREYHSLERVAWMQWRPSVVSGKSPCDNAHTENGGISRKAGYETIVPLTRQEHRNELHQIGVRSFEEKYGVDLKEKARETQAAWMEYQLAMNGPPPEETT